MCNTYFFKIHRRRYILFGKRIMKNHTGSYGRKYCLAICNTYFCQTTLVNPSGICRPKMVFAKQHWWTPAGSRQQNVFAKQHSTHVRQVVPVEVKKKDSLSTTLLHLYQPICILHNCDF